VSNDKDSPQNVNTPGAPRADITIPHGAVDPLVAYLVRQRMKDGLGRNHIVSLCYRPENNNYVWVQYDRDGPDPIHHVLDMGPDVKMERLYVSVSEADPTTLEGSVTGKVIGVHPPGIPGDFNLPGVWAPHPGGDLDFTFPDVPDVPTFIDVPKHNPDGSLNPFYEPIERGVAMGIISGYINSDGKREFRPGQTVNRAQVMAMILRALHKVFPGAGAQSAGKKGK
jgi:hypothetical protein